MDHFPRRILHLDLDAFFCAVEEQRTPSLIGKAFAVGGRPDERGVVASCSYAARAFGVRSAMPMARAVKLCPGLVIVPSHFQAYRATSQQVMSRLHEITSLVEQISIDEAFLDLTDNTEPAEEVARRLQRAIQAELGLPCSLGLAGNKLVAKIATEVGKAASHAKSPPNAFVVVSPGQEAEFLAPLPVEMLWGVGPKTGEQLARLGIRTIGDLAGWPEADLARRFGKNGLEMAQRSKGIDQRAIVTSRQAKSISQEVTFSKDILSEGELRQTLRSQSKEVALQLQKHHISGTTVRLKLRWPDFTTITRQTTMEEPSDQPEIILKTAEQLFAKVWEPGKAVRLIGVGVSGLAPRPRQLGLWDVVPEKERRLQAAIEDLQSRFGEHALNRGATQGYQEEE